MWAHLCTQNNNFKYRRILSIEECELRQSNTLWFVLTQSCCPKYSLEHQMWINPQLEIVLEIFPNFTWYTFLYIERKSKYEIKTMKYLKAYENLFQLIQKMNFPVWDRQWSNQSLVCVGVFLTLTFFFAFFWPDKDPIWIEMSIERFFSESVCRCYFLH